MCRLARGWFLFFPQAVFSAITAAGSMRCTSDLLPHGDPRGSQPPWPTVERDSQGKTHTEGFSLEPPFFPPFLCAETKKWGRRRHVGANSVSFARRSTLRTARKRHWLSPVPFPHLCCVASPLRPRSDDRTRFFIPHGAKAALAVSFRCSPRRSKKSNTLSPDLSARTRRPGRPRELRRSAQLSYAFLLSPNLNYPVLT